jgi:hypothetical protein
MLVTFTVDPDVFSNGYTQDELYRHEKLIELWQQVGCFIFAGDTEASARFSRALHEAPAAIQKRWQTALTHLRHSCCVADFDPGANNGDIDWLSRISDSVRVVSLEATRSLCWGLPEDKYSFCQDGSTEICRFGHESESALFKRARLLSNAPIEAGQPVQHVWGRRLQHLALESRTIVVIDRYALENLMLYEGPAY